MMVGSSGGKIIVNSGTWPCVVCGKGVQTNSVQCTVCKNWIHRWCSGVRGDLYRVADGFRCRRCEGTIQEVDLDEDLMVNGETWVYRAFVIWETHLMEMVERILLPLLESEMDG